MVPCVVSSTELVSLITLRYFAYGSNMLVGRIRQPDRAPSAVPVSTASLPGYQLHFHKRSLRDGSGKCNILQTRLSGDIVHGVLYEVTGGDSGTLDIAEGFRRGYLRKEVRVLSTSGWTTAFTYVAQYDFINGALQPFHWYKDFVVAGANEHALPAPYVRGLLKLSSQDDPDVARDEAARMILAVATNGCKG